MMQNLPVGRVVNFAHPQRVEQVRAAGPAGARRRARQGWARLPVRRVRPDGSESENIIMFAPPVQADLIRPTMLEGRWLLPDDEHALVVSTGMLKNEPDIKVGDEVVLKVDGRETTFRVVGVTLGLPFISQVCRLCRHRPHHARHGQVSSLMVVTGAARRSVPGAGRRRAGSAFQAGRVARQFGGDDGGRECRRRRWLCGDAHLLALVMAFLLAVVGGLGLMGTL